MQSQFFFTPTLFLFSFDAFTVYLSAVFFGAPFFKGWYWTLLFALSCTCLNVTPRTLLGSASYSQGSYGGGASSRNNNGAGAGYKHGASRGALTSDDSSLEDCSDMEIDQSHAEHPSCEEVGPTPTARKAVDEEKLTVEVVEGADTAISLPASSDRNVATTTTNRRGPTVYSSVLTSSGKIGANSPIMIDIFDIDEVASAIIDDQRYYFKLPNRLHRNISFRVAVFAAAAAGAVVTPLDAENWWQFWPVPSFTMAGAVAIVAMAAPKYFFLPAKRRRQQKYSSQQRLSSGNVTAESASVNVTGDRAR